MWLYDTFPDTHFNLCLQVTGALWPHWQGRLGWGHLGEVVLILQTPHPPWGREWNKSGFMLSSLDVLVEKLRQDYQRLPPEYSVFPRNRGRVR